MVTIAEGGLATFDVYLPDAGKVEVVGDFTSWGASPIPLRPRPEAPGWWRGQIPLQPGDHSFQYLVDSDAWVPDFAAHGVERNCYGTWVSLLRIGDAPNSSRPKELPLVGGEMKPAPTRGNPDPFAEVRKILTVELAQTA